MGKVHIKKGDTVVVLAGKARTQTGRVLRVLPEENRAIVEGLNMMKRHTRPNPNRQIQGGVIEREAPIHISNLKVVDPDTKKPTRVGRRQTEDGRRVRYAKVSGKNLD